MRCHCHSQCQSGFCDQDNGYKCTQKYEKVIKEVKCNASMEYCDPVRFMEYFYSSNRFNGVYCRCEGQCKSGYCDYKKGQCSDKGQCDYYDFTYQCDGYESKIM